jgi:small-conductance mechanosensitive channel
MITIENISQLLNQEYYSNTIGSYIVVLLAIILIVLTLKLAKLLLITKLIKKYKTDINSFKNITLSLIHRLFTVQIKFLVAINLALFLINIPDKLQDLINFVNLSVLLYFIASFLVGVISILGHRFSINLRRQNRNSEAALMSVFIKTLKFLVWSITIVLLLRSIGYDVTTLIAGVSISSIAVVFALQNILQDLFASVSIHFDQPFKVGDYVEIGNDKGIVKRIGLKTTRINSIGGEEIIISNKELTNTRIRNYSKLKKKNETLTITLSLDNERAKLNKFKNKLSNQLDNIDNEFIFEKIYIKEVTKNALQYEIMFSIKTTDPKHIVDIKDKIYQEILDYCDKHEITFG